CTALLAIDLAIAARPEYPVAERSIYAEPEIARIIAADARDAGVVVYDADRLPDPDPSRPPSRAREIAYAMRRLAPGIGPIFGFRNLLDVDLSMLRAEDFRAFAARAREWREPERYRALGHVGI